jgi:DNA-binding XRE family transcriptional regulator
MPKTKVTPGTKVWLSLYYADHYDQQAGEIVLPSGSPGMSAEFATRRWLEGMSRHLKKTFPTEVRKLREKLGLTQQQLANIAELTVTAVAMLERGERVPNLDTAARLCWALDVAGGTLPELP